jgi:hypothetical protein
MQRFLDGTRPVTVTHACAGCGMKTSIPIPSATMVRTEYRADPWVHDIVLIADDRVVFVIEIYFTHEVADPKRSEIPCPWIEIEATRFLDYYRDLEKGTDLVLLARAARLGQHVPILEPECSVCTARREAEAAQRTEIFRKAADDRESARRHRIERLATFFRRYQDIGFRLEYDRCRGCSAPKSITSPPGRYVSVAIDYRQMGPDGEQPWDLALINEKESCVLLVLHASNPRLRAGKRGAEPLPGIPWIIVGKERHDPESSRGYLVAIKHQGLKLPSDIPCPICRELEKQSAAEMEKKRAAASERVLIESEIEARRPFEKTFRRIRKETSAAVGVVQDVMMNIESTEEQIDTAWKNAVQILGEQRVEGHGLPSMFEEAVDRHFQHLEQRKASPWSVKKRLNGWIGEDYWSWVQSW